MLPCDTGRRAEGSEIGPSMGADPPARRGAGAAVAPESCARQGGFSSALI